jgi:hypothetical protein
LRAALSSNIDILQKNGITFTNFNNVVTNDTIDALYNFADSLEDVSEANLYYAGQILNNRRAEYYGEVTSEAATTESGEIDYGQ